MSVTAPPRPPDQGDRSAARDRGPRRGADRGGPGESTPSPSPGTWRSRRSRLRRRHRRPRPPRRWRGIRPPRQQRPPGCHLPAAGTPMIAFSVANRRRSGGQQDLRRQCRRQRATEPDARPGPGRCRSGLGRREDRLQAVLAEARRDLGDERRRSGRRQLTRAGEGSFLVARRAADRLLGPGGDLCRERRRERPADGSFETGRLFPSSPDSWLPAWSPDGRKIAFVRQGLDEVPPRSQPGPVRKPQSLCRERRRQQPAKTGAQLPPGGRSAPSSAGHPTDDGSRSPASATATRISM